MSAFIAPSSSSTQSMVSGRHFSHERNWLYLELFITEMPINDRVFQEINAHAYTVDTCAHSMHSFFPLLSMGKQAKFSCVCIIALPS